MIEYSKRVQCSAVHVQCNVLMWTVERPSLCMPVELAEGSVAKKGTIGLGLFLGIRKTRHAHCAS